MGAPTSLLNLFAATVSSSNGGLVTILTHGSSLKNPDGTAGYGGVLDRIAYFNEDTTAHVIVTHRVPSSSSADAKTVIDKTTLPTQKGFIIEGPFYGRNSDYYQYQLGGPSSSAAEAIASAASTSAGARILTVTAQAWYHEMS